MMTPPEREAVDRVNKNTGHLNTALMDVSSTVSLLNFFIDVTSK